MVLVAISRVNDQGANTKSKWEGGGEFLDREGRGGEGRGGAGGKRVEKRWGGKEGLELLTFYVVMFFIWLKGGQKGGARDRGLGGRGLVVGKGESEGGNKTFNLVNLSLWLVGPGNGVHPGPNCRVGQGDESTTAEQPVSPPPNSPLLLLGGVEN